jgi:phosphoglycolate phosphatase-like HAD superfamily hydrolase
LFLSMTSPASIRAPRAVLFDLDGTLADTAPDLAAAVNWLRTERGLAPTPYSVLRPTASAGARGMIGAAFGLAPGDEGYEELRLQWFDRYQDNMAVESGLFKGVAALLQGIEDAGMAWGVVTNKPARFTDPLIPQIGLAHAGCIVSGDTMPHAKPHPAPLLEGARRKTAGTSATTCATSKPAAPPACRRWPAPGDIAAPSNPKPGAPTSCALHPSTCSRSCAAWRIRGHLPDCRVTTDYD